MVSVSNMAAKMYKIAAACLPHNNIGKKLVY